ncbi:MAG: DUF6588 family protein [Balneolaceae bacterium]|nr:DUF6588 family protein [Balneolaceae bacterium]
MQLVKKSATALILFLFTTVLTVPSKAQIGNVERILQASKADANKLVQAYLKPFGSGFGAGLNTGWTNTAQPHKTLGFDLTISAGLAIVPDSDLEFDIADLKLDQLQVQGENTVTPTINGAGRAGPTMEASATVNDTERTLFNFEMPAGTGFRYTPAPMIKASVGLIKNTEVMFRYTPELNINDFGTFQLLGGGVKHDIKQWLPGSGLIPVDISVMFGYTSMDVNSPFEIRPDDVMEDPGNTENSLPASTWQGQGIEMQTDAWTINALVGKTLPVISVYGGVGYEASTFSITTPGSYPTVVPTNPQPAPGSNEERFVVEAIEGPVDVEIKGENGFRALAGFRLRFTIFHISGSYTLSKYPSYNVGFGISFR